MLSASVRHTSPSCGGDLFVADTDDLKPMKPFEIHVKNSSNQKRCTFKKWHWTCLPCKMGSRHPPLCTKREAISGNHFKEKCVEKGEARHPSPDLEASQDFWSVLGDDMIMLYVAPRTKLFVPKGDFPISLNYMDVSRQTKNSIDVFQEATIDGYCNIMAISHCPNFASVWHDSSLFDKVHQKGFCGFKANWRRNRFSKTQNGHLITDDDLGYEEIVRNRKQGEFQRCFVKSHHTSRPEWSKMETKRLNASCSKKDHEKITVESQRIRSTMYGKKIHKDHIGDTGFVFPCRIVTWFINRVSYRVQWQFRRQRLLSTRNGKLAESSSCGRVKKWTLELRWYAEQH